MKVAAGLLCLLVAFRLTAQTAPHRDAFNATGTKGAVPSIGALQEKIAALEKEVNELKTTTSVNSFLVSQKTESHTSVLLDPSNHTFQMLDGSVSTFLVLVQDVSPYLNGYRVTLNVGNPEDAAFSNVTFTIRWAKAYDYKHYSVDSYEKWRKSINEKEVTLTTNLLAGSWNTVTMDLVPCNADQIGYMELSMKTPSVVLHTN